MRQFPLYNIVLQNKNISVVKKHWKYRIVVPMSISICAKHCKCMPTTQSQCSHVASTSWKFTWSFAHDRCRHFLYPEINETTHMAPRHLFWTITKYKTATGLKEHTGNIFRLWFELWFKLWFGVWLKLWPKIEESSMISLRGGGLVAAVLGARAGPGLALAPRSRGPGLALAPVSPRAATHHPEGKSSTILQF